MTQQQRRDALLREREGYVARGRQDRVAQVDEQLERLQAAIARAATAAIARATTEEVSEPEPETTQAAPLPERAVPPKPTTPRRPRR